MDILLCGTVDDEDVLNSNPPGLDVTAFVWDDSAEIRNVVEVAMLDVEVTVDAKLTIGSD